MRIPVPSAVFLALHALLLPAIAWNYFKRHQWNTLIVGSTIYAVDRWGLSLSPKTSVKLTKPRVVLYSLRLRQAYGAAEATSTGLLTYQQITFGKPPSLQGLNPPQRVGNRLWLHWVDTRLPHHVSMPLGRDDAPGYRGWSSQSRTAEVLGPATHGRVCPLLHTRPCGRWGHEW